MRSYFLALSVSAPILKRSFPSFCSTIIWRINMLGVWYILSETNLEMNREVVIEIGPSGLIPVDLEAWINLNFAKLSGCLPLYALVTSHYRLAAVQLCGKLYALSWSEQNQWPSPKAQILLKFMRISQDFPVLRPGHEWNMTDSFSKVIWGDGYCRWHDLCLVTW